MLNVSIINPFLKDFGVTCNRTLPLFVVCDVGNPMDPNQTVSKIYLDAKLTTSYIVYTVVEVQMLCIIEKYTCL